MLGIGSPFGDDRAGWLVGQIVAQSAAAFGMNLDVVTLDRPGVSLLHVLADCSEAIVVDAMVSGAEPGRIHRLDLSALEGMAGGSRSTHGFGLADALRLAAAMEGLPPRLRIYGIEIDPRAPGPTPSPEVARAAARLAAEILETVCAGHGSPARGES
jgi:hydrogenase maturation protease